MNISTNMECRVQQRDWLRPIHQLVCPDLQISYSWAFSTLFYHISGYWTCYAISDVNRVQNHWYQRSTVSQLQLLSWQWTAQIHVCNLLWQQIGSLWPPIVLLLKLYNLHVGNESYWRMGQRAYGNGTWVWLPWRVVWDEVVGSWGNPAGNPDTTTHI